MPTNRRAAQLLAATCTALEDAVTRHMPAGPYRDFTAWAYSADNPRRHEYLQSSGVIQLVTMTNGLLTGLVEEDDWPVLLHFAGLMNAYQVFEVVSDNLAIGLGSPRLDAVQQERLDLVSSLNRAMLQTLAPAQRTPAMLLLAGPAREAARHASGFDLSLARAKHAGMAEEYARHVESLGRTAPMLDELEYGVWSALIANIESCRDLIAALADTDTATLVRQGLADRYRAADRTLRATHLSRLELAVLGEHSILVTPTLGYFIGVLCEVLVPVPGYLRALADGTMADLYADAAVLVRLQNDIGSRLLRLPALQQNSLIQRLAAGCAQVGASTAEDALNVLATATTSTSPEPDPLFTRLQKDIDNAESNLALWHMRRAGDAEGALRALADSLSYYAGLYAQHSARLAGSLAELDERLGDRRAGTVVDRFVRFHERMYAHRHTDPIGEYAV
ncbi:hypothetical protein QEZ54_12860 [Catellatospora sp. KI3]|uniref:hypothetical protein n=1 Tax=Catellatospora sp. KI3 TaxID=3041620 RepID=UPI002482522E|nr:hypothetical protein [Catellatospora sp. KI3]MDI1461863.1 hypothetical protein [Catellatospora sp. KI3]